MPEGFFFPPFSLPLSVASGTTLGPVTSNTATVISLAPAVATPAPTVTSPSLTPSATAAALSSVKQEAVRTTETGSTIATSTAQGPGQLVMTPAGLGGANLAAMAAAAGLNPGIISPSQLTQGYALTDRGVVKCPYHGCKRRAFFMVVTVRTSTSC